MNISNSILGNTKSEDRYNVDKTTSDGSNRTTSATNNEALLKDMIFKGEITNITNKDVTILMDNMRTINARMLDSLSLNIGDILEFQVTDSDKNLVTIKALERTNSDNAMLRNIDIALEKNGFLPSEKNINIAKELMNASMPLNKDNMRQIMMASAKYPNASINSLVNMSKLGIPINEQNISLYNQYVSNSHQLNNQISELKGNINSHFMNLISNGDVDLIQSDTSKLLDVLLFDDTANNTSNLNNETILNQNNEADKLSSEGGKSNNQVGTSESLIENGFVNEAGTHIEDGLTNKEDNLFVYSKTNSDNENIELNFQNNKLTLTNKEMESLVKQMENYDVDINQLNSLINNADSDAALLAGLNKMLKNAYENGIDVRDFYDGKEFSKLLNQAIVNNFSMKSNDVKSSKELNDFYNRIYEQSARLANSFSDSKSGKGLSEDSKNMKQNIEFINELSHIFGYTQIPLKAENGINNSELYVYANKNKLRNNNDEKSVLLHLDMDNLGPTDIHITLDKNNTVNAKFVLYDSLSANICTEHMEELRDALARRGFSLINSVTNKSLGEENKTMSMDVVVDTMFELKDNSEDKRFNFDIRM